MTKDRRLIRAIKLDGTKVYLTIPELSKMIKAGQIIAAGGCKVINGRITGIAVQDDQDYNGSSSE